MLLILIVGIVVAMVVPATIYRVFRTLGIGRHAVGGERLDAASEARLARMEEAIDAMAVEVERLRQAREGRYVSRSPAEPPTEIRTSGEELPPA